jgi:hypothetical protein
MDLQDYLNQTGYTRRVRELADMMRQRDRFARMLDTASATSRKKGQKALAGLDAKIDLTVDILGDEYEEAIKYLNSSYMLENGFGVLHDLIPRVIAELEKPEGDVSREARAAFRPTISH